LVGGLVQVDESMLGQVAQTISRSLVSVLPSKVVLERVERCSLIAISSGQGLKRFEVLPLVLKTHTRD